MFSAGLLAVAMILLFRCMLEPFWGISLSSIVLTFCIGILYMESMFLFTSEKWDEFAGQSAWNLIPTVIIIIGTVVVGIPASIVTLLIFPFTKNNKWLRYKTVRVTAILFSFVFGTPADFDSTLPQDGKARLLFAKHTSMTEIVDFTAGFNGSFAAVAKSLMFHLPLFGTFLQYEGIKLPRMKNGRVSGSSAIRAKEETKERLAKGQHVLIYPEGHRSKTLLDFKSLMAKVAFENDFLLTPIIDQRKKPYVGLCWLQPHPRRRIRFGKDISPVPYESWQELNEAAHKALEHIMNGETIWIEN